MGWNNYAIHYDSLRTTFFKVTELVTKVFVALLRSEKPLELKNGLILYYTYKLLLLLNFQMYFSLLYLVDYK